MPSRISRFPDGTIVFIPANPGAYEGASELLWQQTALWLLKQGRSVVVCLSDFGPLPECLEELRKAGALFHFRSPFVYDDENNRNLLSFEKWLIRKNWIRSPGRRDTLQWLLARKPALVVVCQKGNTDGAWCIGDLAAHEIPLVTMTHQGGCQLWPFDRQTEQLVAGMGKARMNYFCSENNLDWMEAQIGMRIPNSRIFRKTYKVPFHPVCTWPDENIFQLAMVGRLDPKTKGHDLAFSVLARDVWRSRAVQLNVYGEGCNSRSLRKLADYWNLQRIVFHDRIGDLEALWSANHFLLQPSRQEGLPCSLVEAMLCGRGAVVTDVGGNAEMIEEGVSGFVAAYPYADFVAEAMERCWRRRHEAAEIGKAARRKAESCIPEDPHIVFGGELLGLIHG